MASDPIQKKTAILAGDVADVFFMFQALQQAQIAYQLGEVPVGAVVVLDNRIISRAFNSPISDNDPTAHAELKALKNAGAAAGNYRLVDATLYVTIEPCTMCFGGIIHARIRRVVFAAREPKAGRVCSHSLIDDPCFNHKVDITEGILAEQSSALIQRFFAERREAKKISKT